MEFQQFQTFFGSRIEKRARVAWLHLLPGTRSNNSFLILDELGHCVNVKRREHAWTAEPSRTRSTKTKRRIKRRIRRRRRRERKEAELWRQQRKRWRRRRRRRNPRQWWWWRRWWFCREECGREGGRDHVCLNKTRNGMEEYFWLYLSSCWIKGRGDFSWHWFKEWSSRVCWELLFYTTLPRWYFRKCIQALEFDPVTCVF